MCIASKLIIRERKSVLMDSVDMRLDQFAAQNLLSLPSRKSAYKAAKKGTLLLNGRRVEPSRRIHVNDEIILRETQTRSPVLRLRLDVLWEDKWMAVVCKPPGIPVNGNFARTVERALPNNLTVSTVKDALPCPQPAHRLDAPTGGLLIVAKNAKSLMNLNRQFEYRLIHKKYRAIVIGHLKKQVSLCIPINGKDAETIFCIMGHHRSLRTEWITTVDLIPVTGRTHQLRKHLASIGHPIVGDVIYGAKKNIFRGKGLFLWAIELEFAHPVSGEKNKNKHR